MGRPAKGYLCDVCLTTVMEDFYTSRKTICKKCELEKKKKPIPKPMLKQVEKLITENEVKTKEEYEKKILLLTKEINELKKFQNEIIKDHHHLLDYIVNHKCRSNK